MGHRGGGRKGHPEGGVRRSFFEEVYAFTVSITLFCLMDFFCLFVAAQGGYMDRTADMCGFWRD